MSENKSLKGGEFLIKETLAEDVFIPEEFNEEQRMIAQSCRDFTETQVLPQVDQLEKHDRELLTKLLKDAGELGLLGISVPEEYDGFGQKFVTSMLTVEEMGKGFSFAVAYSAHTGIGTLPILYYGTEEQKKKYLPKLASGEFLGAYCLTEAEAGSDPNSGKTKAILSQDGTTYSLNGVKIWITNGGVADLLIVFAKIGDDKNLSAFIVETNAPGITIGADEEKMGIKGSSTVQIYFDNAIIPAENLLGERDGGFKIALNILNLGRIKLSGATVGACKATIDEALHYANERKQFGTLISSFGAIKWKLGEMAILTFASESLTYRASQNIDDAIQSFIEQGLDKGKATLEGIRQYAIEASIAKVFGSEVLDYVVDEAVQIYGGMGYSSETLVERAYRDSRINRIFEGTNEINRMVIVGELLKRAMKGEIDLMTPAKAVGGELMGIPDFGSVSTDYFEAKKKMMVNFKKSILMVAGAAIQKYMDKFADEQEILMALADMIITTYAAESCLLRTEKLSTKLTEEKLSLYKDMTDVFFYDAAGKINKSGVDAVNAFAAGDEQQAMLMGMKRFTKSANVNSIAARRRIADRMIEDNRYSY
ncbi:MAG: acyl-CoA dehydrogenase [Bacteroidetes bacterium HGW-Bacteroidetes-16]|jgi:alkylation response protein AidB-like acyl-CoA dehydrogenase|nr:MAG: acyl-CoA dehydrogenase [Bacteroidetes bacterium HGW-Bacteroidetes-16]